jgi:CTP:molybdopterin cytidylyltransferase MocA
MIAAVVLAAGASMRFGSPKQQVLLPRVLERVRASSVDEVVVVLGAHEVETDARAVRCRDWERGPGASLRCGLEALGEGIDAAVVVLGDGPNLDPRAIERVISAWRTSHADRVAAIYRGVRLHPLLLSRHAWGQTPDVGLRDLPAELVPCDDLSPPGDVDFADQVEGGWPPQVPE